MNIEDFKEAIDLVTDRAYTIAMAKTWVSNPTINYFDIGFDNVKVGIIEGTRHDMPDKDYISIPLKVVFHEDEYLAEIEYIKEDNRKKEEAKKREDEAQALRIEKQEKAKLKELKAKYEGK